MATTVQHGILVQVVYAEPDSAWQMNLQLPDGATLEQALQASRFASLHPNYPYDDLKVGIYGQVCALDHVLADGDRVEIYRPLDFDPIASRQRRAAHRKASMIKARNRPKRRKAKETAPAESE
ncbi:RnfH family protein [Alcaligenaceae bacterium]|nr:RnfH family protein [Alcaligenaceae bacterium]